MCPLCRGKHHRAAHEGTLVVRGDAVDGFQFFHADGTPYGAPTVSADTSDAFTVAFRRLRESGYKETETRRLLDEVGPHVGQGATAATLVEAAQVWARKLALVEGGLATMGFKTKEARGAVESVRSHVGVEIDANELFQRALRTLA